MKFHEAYGVSQNCEVADAKKVELEESCIFHGIHIILRDDLSSLWIVLCRNKVDKWCGGDDNSRCVYGHVAYATFEFLCEVDYFSSFSVCAIEFFEIWLELHRMLEGHWEPL